MAARDLSHRNRILADLAELQKTERRISDQRRKLHEKIDGIYLAAPLDHGMTALLAQLEHEERLISDIRFRLHQRIDALRISVGLPTWRQQHAAHNAA